MPIATQDPVLRGISADIPEKEKTKGLSGDASTEITGTQETLSFSTLEHTMTWDSSSLMH